MDTNPDRHIEEYKSLLKELITPQFLDVLREVTKCCIADDYIEAFKLYLNLCELVGDDKRVKGVNKSFDMYHADGKNDLTLLKRLVTEQRRREAAMPTAYKDTSAFTSLGDSR